MALKKTKSPATDESRSAGRRANKQARERLGSLNSVQLENFFNGFTSQKLRAFRRAMDKAEARRRSSEIQKTETQIKELQAKLNELRG